MKVPLVVKLIAKNGEVLEENTETKIVNAHGCMVSLRTPVLEGQTVELVNPETNSVRPGRVTWCGATEPDGRTQVAIEMDTADPKFWGDRYVDLMLWGIMHPG